MQILYAFSLWKRESYKEKPFGRMRTHTRGRYCFVIVLGAAKSASLSPQEWRMALKKQILPLIFDIMQVSNISGVFIA